MVRIGYSGYSADWSGPGDRRRLVYYARARKLEIEPFRAGERYDLVALGQLSDLPAFASMPRNGTKVLFDLCDSYLDVDPRSLQARLRGPAKFLLRQHSQLEWSFHRALEKMCARADAVVCSTPEQRERILPFNSNVHPILDFHTGSARQIKEHYDSGATLNLLWEGLAGNLSTFSVIADVLRAFSRERPIALHAITDLEYKLVNGPVPKVPTRRLVDRVLPGIPTYLYDWNEQTFASIACSCDFALIPMFVDRPIYRAKAENKLLLMWRMGIPTITSATPAYSRTMRDAGVEMSCTTTEEWTAALRRYGADAPARADAGRRGRAFAEQAHGEAACLARWDALFASLGFGTTAEGQLAATSR